jgi:hypothetical protein
MNKPQCKVCGRKEGKHPEFGYRVGFYEDDYTIGGRSDTYRICTRCKSMSVKGGAREFNGFTNNAKRIVYIPESARESRTPS